MGCGRSRLMEMWVTVELWHSYPQSHSLDGGCVGTYVGSFFFSKGGLIHTASAI
jgi:hypothetical protein